MIYQNVVIGEPICHVWQLTSYDEHDYEENDKQFTLFTEERFLPKIMVLAGIVKSVSEVRRNQPKLMKTLDELDCVDLKWGKKRLYIIVGK